MSRKYALMWSGGKDSALVLDRARSSGLNVARLINFYEAATGRVRFHGTAVAMIEAQAAAIGIQLVAIGTTWAEMEARLVEELAAIRSEGFAGVVFGDIHLADVRAWYEQRVTAAGLEHVESIWGEAPAKLLGEFVHTGGRAVVTCVDLTRLDGSWLGRIIAAMPRRRSCTRVWRGRQRIPAPPATAARRAGMDRWFYRMQRLQAYESARCSRTNASTSSLLPLTTNLPSGRTDARSRMSAYVGAETTT